MDVAAGEYPDYPQAASAFQRALEVDPRLVSTETVNAVSILATMPARPHQKARNLASAYTWLRSRSDEDLRYSSARVTAEGYAVGPDGSEPGAARSAGAAAGDNNAQARGERVNPQLANWLVAGTDAVERNMEQLIRDPRDAPEAASVLLQLVDDAAPPHRLAEWQRLAALSERTGGSVERLLYDRVMNIEQTLETEWKPVEPPAAVATDAPQPTHPGGVSPATHETPRESASLAGAIIRWWWIPALLAILAAAIGGAWLLLSMRRA
jgi:hypothetical protein